MSKNFIIIKIDSLENLNNVWFSVVIVSHFQNKGIKVRILKINKESGRT